MSRNRLICLVLVASLVVPAAALAVPADKEDKGLTVGDFAVMVASRISADATHPVTQPEAAASLLAKSGIRFQSNLASQLTEAEAAGVLAQFGISLQISHPAEAMNRGKALALVDSFAAAFSARSIPGSKEPTFTLDVTLVDCQNLATVKECHTCCRDLGYKGRTCGQTCSNSPKASATEPTP